jgi:hypothetical protein
MNSARRRAFIERKKKGVNITNLLVKILFPLVLVFGIFIFIKVSTHFWDGDNKVSIAFREGSGDVAVMVIDPELDEITTLVIPGDTQVDVAHNYGTLRIKNVWQLGINEKVGGSLLPETITNNFFFPVFLWSEDSAGSLGKNGIAGILHFIFFPGATNVPFGDRLQMGLFALRIQNPGKTEIDLGQSQFLTKQKLNDGQTGYVISGPISQRLTVYFSDNEVGNQNLKVDIVDATGVPGVADTVGQILEVIGGKVVSVDKILQPENTDCIIIGMNTKMVKKISNLFSCQIGKGSTNFDLEIQLGQKFAARF